MDLNEKSQLKSGLLSLITEVKRQKRNKFEGNQGRANPETRKYFKVMSSKDLKKPREDESKSKSKINTEHLKRALCGEFKLPSFWNDENIFIK